MLKRTKMFAGFVAESDFPPTPYGACAWFTPNTCYYQWSWDCWVLWHLNAEFNAPHRNILHCRGYLLRPQAATDVTVRSLSKSRTIARSTREKSACLRKHFTDYSAGLLTTFNVFAINLHRHRSLPSVCCDYIRYCLLFLTSTVFALSCRYTCDFVIFLSAQQFRQLTRPVAVVGFFTQCASVAAATAKNWLTVRRLSNAVLNTTFQTPGCFGFSLYFFLLYC